MIDPQRRLIYGRLAAVIQGIIWLVAGSFGGWGFLAGPMAMLAAMVGGRFRLIARVMLLLPIAFLVVGWAPVLFEGASLGSPKPLQIVAILALLMVPGLAAVVLFGTPRTPGDESPAQT
ncbi:MAG: hypothetical protein Q8Q52_08830 [Acidimicrobiia bacterium]|nr:hypothetical protein [Acidimicrobiia bacterium]